MKERPIIMSAESIRAILDGRKSQTRRVIRPQPWHSGKVWKWTKKGRVDDIEEFMRMDRVIWDDRYVPMGLSQFCPYGIIGDHLWVRETWAAIEQCDQWKPRDLGDNPYVWYKASPNRYTSADASVQHGRWRSPIHMPKRLTRIWREVVSVRAEQVQDITIADAIAEGYETNLRWPDPIDWFRALWDGLNAKRGHPWSANDWVWVVSSKAMSPD